MHQLLSTGGLMDQVLPRHLRLRGSKLAYYLKKRYPEVYQRVREVRDRYGVSWDVAVAIALGELPAPTTSTSTSFEAIAKSVEDLKTAVSELRTSLQDLQTAIKLLEWSILPRFTVDKFRCEYIDSDGYCIARDLPAPVPGLRVREVETPSGKRYRINVYEHKLICAFCSLYKPRGESGWPSLRR
jgi:hypothetical protein